MMNVESFIQNYISYRKLYRGLDNGVEFCYTDSVREKRSLIMKTPQEIYTEAHSAGMQDMVYTNSYGSRYAHYTTRR